MTIVHIDTVFALNAVLDYLLLIAAARLAAAPFRRLRLLLGAALGGVYAVLVFLPGLGFLSHPVIRICWALLMTAAAYGIHRSSLRLTVLFFAISCVLAGILVMLSLFWSVSLSYPQGIPVTRPDWKALLLAGAICYFLSATVLRRLVPNHARELLPMTLYWANKQVSLTVLLDSGNLLTDPVCGSSVPVVEWNVMAQLFPPEAPIKKEDVSDPVQGLSRLGDAQEGRLHLLSYRGIGASKGLLLAVRLDSAKLDKQVIRHPLIALAPESISDGSYQGIIGTTQIRSGGQL